MREDLADALRRYGIEAGSAQDLERIRQALEKDPNACRGWYNGKPFLQVRTPGGWIGLNDFKEALCGE